MTKHKQITMKNLNELCETFGNHYGYNFFLLQTDTTRESYIEMLIDNGFSPAEIHERLNKQN